MRRWWQSVVVLWRLVQAMVAMATGCFIIGCRECLFVGRVGARMVSAAPQPSRESVAYSSSANRAQNGALILSLIFGTVTERSNAATEERLKSGHAVGGVSIV